MLNVTQIEKLIKKQKKLDSFIIASNNSQDVTNKNKYALKLELYEFINELGAHKHWKKTSFNEKKAQEELIDILHFNLYCLYTFQQDLTSHTLKKVYEELKTSMMVSFKENPLVAVLKIEELFLRAFGNEDWVEIICLIDYINEIMFTRELFEVYEEKYQINIKRQLENY